jgi:hypothetical protein
MNMPHFLKDKLRPVQGLYLLCKPWYPEMYCNGLSFAVWEMEDHPGISSFKLKLQAGQLLC